MGLDLLKWFRKDKSEFVQGKLKLQKGVIPNKYREYWFLEDGKVLIEEPTGEIAYFYCVATDISRAYKLYENHLQQ